MSNNQVEESTSRHQSSEHNIELGSNQRNAPAPTRARISANPTDIICGRGFHIVNHRGNLNLHLMANTYREEYMISQRVDKRRITKLVLDELKNTGARFIRKVVSNGEGADEWEEVEDEAAFKKVSHALRLRTKNESNREDGPMAVAKAARRKVVASIAQSDQPKPRDSPTLSKASDIVVVHGDSNTSISSSRRPTSSTAASIPPIEPNAESGTGATSYQLSNGQPTGQQGVASELAPFIPSLSTEQRLQHEANHQAYWNIMLAFIQQSQR